MAVAVADGGAVVLDAMLELRAPLLEAAGLVERVPALAGRHDARGAVTLALNIAAMEDCSHNRGRALQALEAARALEPDRPGQRIQPRRRRRHGRSDRAAADGDGPVARDDARPSRALVQAAGNSIVKPTSGAPVPMTRAGDRVRDRSSGRPRRCSAKA